MGRKRKLDELDIDIIRALPECRMWVERTAKVVFVSKTCARARIRKIKELTGLDPLNFWDLYKLNQMVEGWEERNK